MKSVLSVVVQWLIMVLGVACTWVGTLAIAAGATEIVFSKDLMWPIPVRVFYATLLAAQGVLGGIYALKLFSKWDESFAKRHQDFFTDRTFKGAMYLLFGVPVIIGTVIMVYARYYSSAIDSDKTFLKGLLISVVFLIAIAKEYYSKEVLDA